MHIEGWRYKREQLAWKCRSLRFWIVFFPVSDHEAVLLSFAYRWWNITALDIHSLSLFFPFIPRGIRKRELGRVPPIDLLIFQLDGSSLDWISDGRSGSIRSMIRSKGIFFFFRAWIKIWRILIFLFHASSLLEVYSILSILITVCVWYVVGNCGRKYSNGYTWSRTSAYRW